MGVRSGRAQAKPGVPSCAVPGCAVTEGPISAKCPAAPSGRAIHPESLV